MDKRALNLDTLLAVAAERELTTPLLLFLIGHRPLAFFAGQMLYAVAPLAALLGLPQTGAWAEWLSAPNAVQVVEAELSARAHPAQR